MIIRWMAILIVSELICCSTVFCQANLVANLNSRSQDPDSPIRLISFCIDCPSPDQEGTIVNALLPRFGLKEYFVSAELVYCIPNLADSDIINEEQFYNRIVVVDRGGISLIDKALKIQETGALGIIIADDGQCNDTFSFCGPRAGSVRDGGFAAHDHYNEMWKDIEIPVLLVTFQTAETIRRLMPVERVLLQRMGYHNITILTNADGTRDEL